MKSNWRFMVFAIAITLIYVPMVFLGVNTFFPEFTADDDCREAIPVKACYLLEDNATAYEKCMNEQQQLSTESSKCYDEVQDQRQQYEGLKFITLMVICLLTTFFLLLKLDKSIVYGLFFGVVITSFIGTIRYLSSRSLVGFILLVLMFFMVIYFISKKKV